MKMDIRAISKKILPYRIFYLLFELVEEIGLINLSIRKLDNNCRNVTRKLTYNGLNDPSYRDRRPISLHELSVFSQNGEDGILLYIFSNIGTTNKTFVEFGVEDGRECNAANLAINYDWSGLMIDGDPENVSSGQCFYQQVLGSQAHRVKFLQAFVTAENINELIRDQRISGDIDLLSIDIDGNDYWVWRAIEQINPRVVVIEYNAAFGSEKSLTIPYDPDFYWNSKSFPEVLYTGASLGLLDKLASEKGYSLICCDSCGVNAFFVKTSEIKGRFNTQSVQEAYYPHAVRTARFGIAGQAEGVMSLKLQSP